MVRSEEVGREENMNQEGEGAWGMGGWRSRGKGGGEIIMMGDSRGHTDKVGKTVFPLPNSQYLSFFSHFPSKNSGRCPNASTLIKEKIITNMQVTWEVGHNERWDGMKEKKMEIEQERGKTVREEERKLERLVGREWDKKIYTCA